MRINGPTPAVSTQFASLFFLVAGFSFQAIYSGMTFSVTVVSNRSACCDESSHVRWCNSYHFEN